jgi:hypothetical protein
MHNVIGKLKKVDRKTLVYNFVLNKKHILYLFIRGMDWYILKKNTVYPNGVPNLYFIK